MKIYRLYSFVVLTLCFSCETAETDNTYEADETSIENTISKTNSESIKEGDIVKNTKLFEHYRNLCNQDSWPEFVDGNQIIKTYTNYPNADFDRAFEWQVISIPFCSDTLIFLHLQSFEEGIYNNYEVAINDDGIITQFELAGEHQPGEVRMKMWDLNTVQVTIINERAECRNYFMDPVNDIFQQMEYGSSIGIPESSPVQSFEVSINNRNRSFDLHTPIQDSNHTKVYFDLYENDQFYFRLPPHSINNFAFSEVNSVLVQDINGDSKQDIIVSASGMTGIGSDGTVPFDRLSVYFQTDTWVFKNEKDFDNIITAEMGLQEIREAFETQYL